MKVKCEYCDNYIDDTEEICSFCGAPNEHMLRSADGVPKTIGELRAFAESKNLPLRQMRFFLGEDVREPRAFGIYQDEGGNFIVYKNKSDGSRTVRYRGEDEAYAVNELYQKMRTEVVEQKARRGVYPTRSASRPFGASSGSGSSPAAALSRRKGCLIALLLALAFLAAIFIVAAVVPDDGYYYYEDTYYYVEELGEDWYVYDAVTESWSPCQRVREIYRNWRDYKVADAAASTASSSQEVYVDTYYVPQPYYGYGYSYGSDYSYSDSYDDDSYDSWDDDWDDDDWDWDSSYDWDSGYTDWDSDW